VIIKLREHIVLHSSQFLERRLYVGISLPAWPQYTFWRDTRSRKTKRAVERADRKALKRQRRESGEG